MQSYKNKINKLKTDVADLKRRDAEKTKFVTLGPTMNENALNSKVSDLTQRFAEMNIDMNSRLEALESEMNEQ